jgi:hypothetical protein
MEIKDEVRKLELIQAKLERQEIIIEDYYKNIIKIPLEQAKTIKQLKDIKKLFWAMPDIIGKDFMLMGINRRIEEVT